MDLRLFEFDWDLTWFCFFLNADETIYGRYGGRDASSAEARLSLKGLHYTMEQALVSHKSPPKAEPRVGKPSRPEDFAAARKHRGCIHCHNVKEFERAEHKQAGTWTRDELWVYPLPENVGITLDIERGNHVQKVLPDSPAARAGLKAGDILQQFAGRRVASIGDAMYALHKTTSGPIPVLWSRDGKEQSGKIEVADGWRKTNITWRPSLLDILPSLPLSGDDLTAEEKKALGLPAERACMKQDKFVHSTLKAVGVQKDDVVVGFDGKTIVGTMEDLLGYVRRNYLVGDRVKLNLLRDGKAVEVAITLK
jgi:hypothetical protein